MRSEGASESGPLLVLALAGFAGAGGVALAAIAAHRVESPALGVAATMLMIHATAVAAILAHGRFRENSAVWTGVAALMLAGGALFSGDIALNALAGVKLFPMAAPVGGSLLILSWIALGVTAILSAIRRT